VFKNVSIYPINFMIETIKYSILLPLTAGHHIYDLDHKPEFQAAYVQSNINKQYWDYALFLSLFLTSYPPLVPLIYYFFFTFSSTVFKYNAHNF